MNLHENQSLFQDAVIATAQQLNIPEIYIEKDYWVTVALYTIYHSPIVNEAIFKGGTALSKCHKLIERFSEDVDIVVIKNVGESNNKLKNKLKDITNAVNTILPEIEILGITNKLGMIRKTAHAYAKQNFNGSFGQVREQIIIQATWLGSSEPSISSQVSSYIYDMMVATNQLSLIEKYRLQKFEVRVLSKERTLAEKVMSLVRFSQTDKPYEDLANKIRHIYDIHMMLKNEEVTSFLDSTTFSELLCKVGADDWISFKNNNDWLNNHPRTSIIFSQPEDTWNRIRNTYNTTFKDLVLGELPSEIELIATLKKIGNRLDNIKWTIEK